MRSRSVVAGVGSVAFGVLTFVGLVVANPPGGTYSAADAAKYVANGHRAAVFVSAYLFLLAVLGLLIVLAYLRDLISAAPDGAHTARIFWATGVAAATSFAIGSALVVGVSIAHAYGGRGVVVTPTLTYFVTEVGSVVIFGPAAILLGFALITLMLGSRPSLPGWLRWSTLVAGLGGVASLAFFPSLLLIAWGIVMGIWLLVASRRPDAARAPVESTAV